MEHTALPWGVMEDWTEEHSIQYKILSRESLTIIGRLDPWVGEYADEQRVNAAYIVRACNLYPELIHVCRIGETLAKRLLVEHPDDPIAQEMLREFNEVLGKTTKKDVTSCK
jgi:hypothetical protein